MIKMFGLWLKMWKNQKGVEGLPLKYAIIILVGAIVIGIAIAMVSGLQGGIANSTAQINNTLTTQVGEQLSQL